VNSRYSHTLKWLNEQHDVVADKLIELERKVSHLQREVDELRAGKADKRGPKPKSDRNIGIKAIRDDWN